MRRFAQYACLGVLYLSSSACAKQTLAPAGLTQVSVGVVCTADTVQALIKPYAVRVEEGFQVEWVLTAESNATALEINRKKGSGWPFDGSLPYKGSKQNPPKAGPMKGGQLDKRFQYDIIATCKDAEGNDRRILIDPDMIIIRRT